MKTKTLVSLLLTTLLGTFFLAVSPASATQTDPNDGHKITLCHRTGSADGGELKNGYNEITVDIASSGLVRGGHTDHEQIGNGPGPDIIPAYEAFKRVQGEWEPFSFPGLNLDYVFPDGTTGAEFLANGCDYNEPPEEPIKVSAEVTFLDANCDYPNRAKIKFDNPPGVIFNKPVGEIEPGGSVIVTAKAAEGYELVGKSKWEHTFAESPTDCEPVITFGKPHASIKTTCGAATVTLKNGAKATEPTDFIVSIDGKVVDTRTILPGESAVLPYTFKEDSGKRFVSVDSGADVTLVQAVKTNCEDEPTPPEEPPTTGTPRELPKTGGTGTAALVAIGLSLMTAGAGAVRFSMMR